VKTQINEGSLIGRGSPKSTWSRTAEPELQALKLKKVKAPGFEGLSVNIT